MMEIEARNRRDLAAVSLVAELDLDIDSPQFEEAYNVVATVVNRNGVEGIEIVGRNFPACTVICLATLGMHYGDGGELWINLYEGGDNRHFLPYLTPPRQSSFGKAFLESLAQLRLPEFQNVEGRKYLTPILLHAGLPASGAGKVWKALSQQIERGYEDGREIVARWRREADDVQGFTRPVRRFIDETGRFASDFVGRLISTLIEESESEEPLPLEELALKHRIPRALIERLRTEHIGGLARRNLLPRPKVVIGSQQDLGPQMLLPMVPSEWLKAQWHVSLSQDEQRILPTSANRDQMLVMSPSELWACELVNEDGVAVAASREFASYKERPLWFFKSSYFGLELFEPEVELEEGTVTVLAPKGTEIFVTNEGEVLKCFPSEEYPALAGKWSGYALFEVLIAEGSQLRIRVRHPQSQDENSEDVVLRVVALPAAPTLIAEISSIASDLQGRRVFTRPPSIAFNKRCDNPGLYSLIVHRGRKEIFRSRLDALTSESLSFHLENAFDWQAGSHTVRVLGPLGSDLFEQFVYLPNLRFETEVEPCSPFGLIGRRLILDGVEPFELAFQEGHSRKELGIDFGSEIIQLSIEIPRVTFDIVMSSDELPKLGALTFTFSDDEFYSSGAAQITLKLPKEGDFTIHLIGEAERVRHFFSTDKEGLARVALVKFNDDVKGLRSRSVIVAVEVPSLQIAEFEVLRILTQVRAKFENVSETDDADGRLSVTVGNLSDAYTVEVTAVNQDLPWFGETVFEVPATTGTTAVLSPEHLPPGRYELKAFVKGNLDGQELDTVQTRLGNERDFQTYIDLLPEDGRKIAVKATRGHRPPHRLSRDEYLQGLPITGEFLINAFFDERHSQSEREASREFLFNDEFDGERFSWMMREFGDSASKFKIERLVVALYPSLVDTPLTDVPPELGIRLWRSSPLLAAASTYPSKDSELIGVRRKTLGRLDVLEQDLPRLFGSTIGQLTRLTQSSFGGSGIFSNENLRSTLAEYVLKIQTKYDREVHDFTRKANGEILSRSKPHLAGNQKLVHAMHYGQRTTSDWMELPSIIQRLAAVVVEDNPMNVAVRAAWHLSSALTFARPLVRWCLLAALYETKIRERDEI